MSTSWLLSGEVPQELLNDRFRARGLGRDNAHLDLEAYLASPDVIRAHSDGRWLVAGFTAEQNQSLVEEHHRLHLAKEAFTFTLLDPSLTQSYGCLYLQPLPAYLSRTGGDPGQVHQASAMVTFWIRQDLQHTDLTAVVVAAVDAWLSTTWPLRAHQFRVLPSESSSVAALVQAGLRQRSLSHPDDPRPYLWFEGGGTAHA